MTKNMITLVTASALSIAVAGHAAQAQGMMKTMDMLSAHVKEILVSHGIPADDMTALTLGQTTEILGCTEGEQNNSVDEKQCVQAALARKN